MRKISYILFILVTIISSCQKKQTEVGVGYVYMGNISIKQDVTSVETKAPAVSDFTVVIKDKSSGTTVYSGPVFSDIKTFTAGEYTVTAYSGNDANAAIDAPYFIGSKDIRIEVFKKTSISITASMAGSTIEAAYPADMDTHFQTGYYLDITSSGVHYSLYPGHKLYVKTGVDASVFLRGVNSFGEAVARDFGAIPSVEAMKNYKYTVSLSLPVFSLPSISEGDVWAGKVYITPITASNVSQGNASKITAGAVYEASSDGVNWISSSSENGNIVISGLSGGTTYSVRARYGAVNSSNTVNVTTEAAVQLDNNSFENWSGTEISDRYGSTTDEGITCYYPSSSTSSGVWATRNTKTTNGATNNIFSNFGVWWRWCSGTIATSDVSQGGKAAEISTLAFYNSKVSGSWKRASVLSYTLGSGTAYTGYLFTGTYDSGSDACNIGVSHTSRPQSISFDYKYDPFPTSDVFLAYAVLYDAGGNIIASTGNYNGGGASSYTKHTLTFNYTDTKAKASKIGVFFRSGNDGYALNTSNFRQINGGYNSSPWSLDRVAGSILKIDNVILNY